MLYILLQFVGGPQIVVEHVLNCQLLAKLLQELRQPFIARFEAVQHGLVLYGVALLGLATLHPRVDVLQALILSERLLP